MEENCIFCKIIKGEIPSFTIYEDAQFKVILDRFPATLGHVLIIPKEHYKDLFELPEVVAKEIYPLAKKMAVLITETMGAEGINIVQNNGEAAGQSVLHFHLHIVPRMKNDGVQLNKTVQQDMTIENLEKIYHKLTNE